MQQASRRHVRCAGVAGSSVLEPNTAACCSSAIVFMVHTFARCLDEPRNTPNTRARSGSFAGCVPGVTSLTRFTRGHLQQKHAGFRVTILPSPVCFSVYSVGTLSQTCNGFAMTPRHHTHITAWRNHCHAHVQPRAMTSPLSVLCHYFVTTLLLPHRISNRQTFRSSARASLRAHTPARTPVLFTLFTLTTAKKYI